MIEYNNKKYKILAIVPARSGSKGVINKNIKKIQGIPLLGYTGLFIKKLTFIDKSICSTDSIKYANLAKNYFLEIPFMRPKKLSEDFVGDIDVLKHALINSEKYYKTKYDLIIMLQPTSPLRKKKYIIEGLDYFFQNKFDALWSVSKTDLKNHPDKQLIIKNKKLYFFSKKGNKVKARQQLSQTYQRNGIFYIIKRKLLLANTFINGNTGAYLMNDKIINIDTVKDFDNFKKTFIK